MEFLLGLSKQEKEKRIARQRLVRRLFWSLGAVALAIQIVVIAFSSQKAQVASAEPSHTATSEQLPVPVATATVAPTPLPPTPVPTAAIPPSPTPTPAVTGTNPVTGRSEAAPPAPLSLSSPPAQVTEQRFQLSGTGRPGDTITVTYHRSVIATGQADQEGRWQIDIPTAPLVRGRNSFAVSAGAGGRPVSFTVVFAPWWLDAPARLQGNLGEGYACAPTVLAMAMDYYHYQDARHAAPATTEIVQALKDQGFIDGYGADAQMLVNLAIGYGYSHSYFYREWSQAHLRRVLDQGTPVIANVRVNMSSSGYGHSVLVIGLSPDGSRVMVNDPTQGMVEYTWDAFDRSWGSFGPPYRHGLVVKP